MHRHCSSSGSEATQPALTPPLEFWLLHLEDVLHFIRVKGHRRCHVVRVEEEESRDRRCLELPDSLWHPRAQVVGVEERTQRGSVLYSAV